MSNLKSARKIKICTIDKQTLAIYINKIIDCLILL